MPLPCKSWLGTPGTATSMANRFPEWGRCFRLSMFFIIPALLAAQPKPRARDLGGHFDGTPGPLNAITDIAGIEIGHTTLIFRFFRRTKMEIRSTGLFCSAVHGGSALRTDHDDLSRG